MKLFNFKIRSKEAIRKKALFYLLIRLMLVLTRMPYKVHSTVFHPVTQMYLRSLVRYLHLWQEKLKKQWDKFLSKTPNHIQLKTMKAKKVVILIELF